MNLCDVLIECPDKEACIRMKHYLLDQGHQVFKPDTAAGIDFKLGLLDGMWMTVGPHCWGGKTLVTMQELGYE